MYERHENEQYFFDAPTVEHLANFVGGFASPCCLCTPLLGQELAKRRVPVTILDVDERFASVTGFCRYDLYRPEALPRRFDLIVCDPPFFGVSLSQLFHAVRMLSHFEYSQPLLLCYLRRRTANLLGTFARFELAPTGYCPSYRTVQTSERNQIEFFSNLSQDHIQRLHPEPLPA